MLLARLEINDFGYLVADYMGAAQYEGTAYDNGKLKFAEAYVRGEIAVKKVQLIERLKLFHGNGHQRAPISVLVYSTKPVIEALVDPFVVQIISEEMLTPNPRIVGWLKVDWHVDKLTPMFVVREGADLKMVDEFFDQVIASAKTSNERERTNNYDKETMRHMAYENRKVIFDCSVLGELAAAG